ncbi:GtrA family protein [Maricaulis sp.]|uniref:GtrA family protein n=1 Tax=Maricaulis sp. TaxID=1486257 RepID=UPI0026293F8B|nr:GtrA family protein [Maricaulis sp.]
MNWRIWAFQLSGYTAVQIFAIGVEYASYTAMIELLGLWPAWGNALAKLAAGSVAVVLHSKFVFGQKAIDAQTVGRYFLLLAINATVTSFLLTMIVDSFGPYWAKIASDCLMILVNFVISKRFIFQKN